MKDENADSDGMSVTGQWRLSAQLEAGRVDGRRRGEME